MYCCKIKFSWWHNITSSWLTAIWDFSNLIRSILYIHVTTDIIDKWVYHSINSNFYCCVYGVVWWTLPAQGPMMRDICGITPEAFTFLWNKQLFTFIVYLKCLIRGASLMIQWIFWCPKHPYLEDVGIACKRFHSLLNPSPARVIKTNHRCPN